MWDLLVEQDVAVALDDAVMGLRPPCIYRVILKFAALLWPTHDDILKSYGLGGILNYVQNGGLFVSFDGF
jgi:hypothetical protein